MITYFLRNVKFNIKKLEEINNYSSQKKYIQQFMPTLKQLSNCKCPKCGAIDKFSFHCTYSRNISFCLSGKIVNFVVTVTRVKCDSCLSTHAILPDFIIPYKIMSCYGICRIVKEAVTSSVLTVCDKLQISYQLIYQYIFLLNSFFANVQILNNQNNYFEKFSEEIFWINLDFFVNVTFHYDYYYFFKWCFLMDRFRNQTYKPIYIGMAQSLPT